VDPAATAIWLLHCIQQFRTVSITLPFMSFMSAISKILFSSYFDVLPRIFQALFTFPLSSEFSWLFRKLDFTVVNTAVIQTYRQTLSNYKRACNVPEQKHIMLSVIFCFLNFKLNCIVVDWIKQGALTQYFKLPGLSSVLSICTTYFEIKKL